MQLFDTHAHLDDEQFDARRNQIVERAEHAGVRHIVAVGTTAASSQACVDLAMQFPSVYAAVGIQPNYCGQTAETDWESIVELAGHPKVVAIGETGLDRYWDHTPFEIQEEFFDQHIRLSQATELPLIIHMRDCGEDILRMLLAGAQRGVLTGVMHSFTGDTEMANACLERGLYISFAGMVTYKKSDELRRTAANIPVDRILIETDAPYLAPHPKRGQRPNEPALLVHTAQCLAEVRGESVEQFAQQTTENALRLFSRVG